MTLRIIQVCCMRRFSSVADGAKKMEFFSFEMLVSEKVITNQLI